MRSEKLIFRREREKSKQKKEQKGKKAKNGAQLSSGQTNQPNPGFKF